MDIEQGRGAEGANVQRLPHGFGEVGGVSGGVARRNSDQGRVLRGLRVVPLEHPADREPLSRPSPEAARGRDRGVAAARRAGPYLMKSISW